MAASQRWGYIRIISGTILGGVLGFYVMHRVETSYKDYGTSCGVGDQEGLLC